MCMCKIGAKFVQRNMKKLLPVYGNLECHAFFKAFIKWYYNYLLMCSSCQWTATL